MSTIEDAADKIFDDASRTLAPAAVGSQVAIMSVISVVTVLLFNFLRPKNKIIYEPKVKYHEGDKPPPRISDSIFGWLPPLANTKEPELLDKIGLDAVTFLRFGRMLRWLFTAISFVACAILIPINVSYNLKHKPKGRDPLSMLTIRDVEGDYLYAHVIVSYIITLLIIGFVYLHWKAMIRLRHTWFRSPEYLQSFYARTLQVIGVPKKSQTDDGLKSIFANLGMPYPTTSVHIGRKVGMLPQLIEYHNQTVREFEQVLVRYLKNGKIKSKRPTIRHGATLGFGGTKEDAIDFYTRKLKKTEAAIEECRNQIDTRKAEPYGFASLAAVPYAHIVAQKLEGKHPKGTTISLAPNPKDIIWSNMNNSDAERARKKTLGIFYLTIVCFFNTIPLLIISFLANLDGIRVYVGFLDEWAESSPGSFAVVSGVLPATISGIFGFFLPIIMGWLTKYMGALTHSKTDRAVIARYFAFLIISQLILFTLIGVLFNLVKEVVQQIGKKASFKEILDNMNGLPDKILRTYVNQASYWLTYFPLRGFLAVFDLAQIINLVWLSFKTRVFGRTPRDIREWTQPPVFQYAVYYSNTLFMASVGLVFAPLAPLVAVAACVVFWMSSWVYKYQLMFVYVSKVESGGRLWNLVVNRLLFCVVLMQSLMVLTIGLQKGFKTYIWISAIPPILFVIAFKVYINRVFIPAFRYFSPTEEEIRLAKVYSERADHKGNKLEKRFGHPALHADLFTPMLHASMMPLLSQVYSGKIENDKAKLDEYGGQNMNAQIVPGGIKIAAINQSDLEYDPVLYQRDRGELDWDQRSISSTTMLNSHTGHMTSPSTAKIHEYYTHGPKSQDIELATVDSMHEPLLSTTAMAYHQQGFESQQTLVSPPSLYQNPNATKSRELYRPLDRSYSPSPAYTPDPQQQYPNYSDTNVSHQYPPQHQRQISGNMLAGHQNRSESPTTTYPPSHSSSHQYPPQQHARQMSGNMLASSQQGRMSPGPNQAYGARAPSPGPNQAYGARAPSPGPNQAYQARSASPGPNQAFQGRTPSPGPHQALGRMSPGPNQAYAPMQPQRQATLGAPGPQPHGRPYVNTQFQPDPQQHARSPSGNLLGGHPQQSSPSPVSPYPQQSPNPNGGNMAGRGAYGRGQ